MEFCGGKPGRFEAAIMNRGLREYGRVQIGVSKEGMVECTIVEARTGPSGTSELGIGELTSREFGGPHGCIGCFDAPKTAAVELGTVRFTGCESGLVETSMVKDASCEDC